VGSYATLWLTVHLASAEGAVQRLERSLGERITTALTLEAAARVLAADVYAALEGALVLARVFGVVRYDALPSSERAIACEVADRAGEAIAPDTRVLTLLASRGHLPEWNERRRSRAHRAIPLASREFVESSPMVASLLRELQTEESDAVVRTFYVFDAKTSVDASGRHTIPDRDFVREHDVRTVFGVGGSLGASTLFALILFARQHVTRAVADRFVPLAGGFASLAAASVTGGRLFDPA
jgi:hypothetical protein